VADDRLAVHRTHPVVGKTETPENPGTEVLDQHIGALDQSLEDPLAVGMLQIACDAPLVAVDREVIRRHAVDRRRRPVARLVAGPRDLDLHDVGAVIREHQRAVRTRERTRQIDDANAIERAAFLAGHRGEQFERVNVTERQSTVDA